MPTWHYTSNWTTKLMTLMLWSKKIIQWRGKVCLHTILPTKSVLNASVPTALASLWGSPAKKNQAYILVLPEFGYLALTQNTQECTRNLATWGKYKHLHCSIWSSWNFVVRSIFSFLWNKNLIEIKIRMVIYVDLQALE